MSPRPDHAFVYGYDDAWKAKLLDIGKELIDPLKEVATTFELNLEAALNVVGIPRLMALTSTYSSRMVIYVAQETYRFNADTPPDEVRKAHEKAKLRFDTEMRDENIKKGMDQDADNFLLRLLSSKDVTRAAEELLAETLVMIWGAFEVLVGDVVRCHVNRNPLLALRLVTAEQTKKYFKSSISVETLAAFGFAVKDTMGDVLLSDQSLDNLQRIRDVASVLFPERIALHTALAENDLYQIWQRRHLIVHRRGVVDDRFVRNTGTATKIGTRLAIVPGDVQTALQLVSETGLLLLAATCS